MAPTRRHAVAGVFAALCASTPQTAIALECIIKPSKTVRLSTPEPGLIANVRVSRGDLVRAGDVVATLISDVEETAVAAARARAEDETEIQAARSRVRVLMNRLKRSETLEKSRVVSEAALEETRSDLFVAVEEAKAARARKDQAALDLRRAQQMLERRRITSPVTGIVMERRLSAGEFFTEDDHVVSIAVLDPLHVETFAPIEFYGRVRAGETAAVEPEPPVGGTYQARVDVVDRVFDAATGTYGIRLVLDNPSSRLPGGIGCNVRFSGIGESN